MRPPFQPPEFLRGLGLLPVLAATLLLAQIVPVSLGSRQWHGAQTLAVETGVVILLAALLLRAEPGGFGRRLLIFKFAPFSFLCLLVAWGAVSGAASPDKPFALQGLFQLFAGVFVAVFMQAQVRTQARLSFVLDTFSAAALLVALSGFALFGGEGLTIATGLLHDHMLFGAFLMLLLPLCLAAAVSPLPFGKRLLAQAAGVAAFAALLASQTRSAWIGAGVSLAVFAALAWLCRPRAVSRFASPGGHRNALRQSLGGAVVLLACAGALFWALPDRDRFLARASTLTTTVAQGKDVSTRWRISAWSGAETMIRQKPLQGWGIGGYARHQFPYTQLGRTPEQVERQGPTILDETHNSYLQLWAELGGVGLALWLAALAGLLVAGARALTQYPARSPAQWALIGCLSALTGQMTDALANPAWQFANIALPLWMVLGLLAALARPAVPAADGPKRRGAAPPLHLGRAALAAGVGGGLLWAVYRTAFALPAPHL